MQVEPFGVLTIDSSGWKRLRSWFLGIGYDDDSIVLGPEGFHAYQAAKGPLGAHGFEEGRYIAVLERPKYFSIITDPMGQDVLYYYSPEKLQVGGPAVSSWVVSNSLVSLMRQARRYGSLGLYRPSLLGFMVAGGKAIGAQLFSNNTPVWGAQVLPVGCELRISRTDGSASLHRLRRGDWLTADDGASYAELLEAYVRASLARITALRSAGRLDLLCDVSGGHDSRAVMGMLQRSEGTSPVTYTTDPTKPGDYAVAKQLARHFGTRLELKSQVPVTLDGATAYDIWSHGSTGVYLPIVVPRAEHETRRLRFHGGNFLSKEFGELPARQRVLRLHKWIKTGERDRAAVAREFLDAFGHMDMDPDAPFAMQMHYINFRGRFHYGRNWFSYTRSPMITPLISPLLARAAFRLTPEQYNRNRVSLDLLLALDNALGVIPFDLPEKDFTAAEMEESPFWRRPVSFDAGTVRLPTLYGLPTRSDVAAGPPLPAGGPNFMEVFRDRFPKQVGRVREEKLFNEAYLEKASSQARAGTAVQEMRAAAHVAHAGLLLEELS